MDDGPAGGATRLPSGLEPKIDIRNYRSPLPHSLLPAFPAMQESGAAFRMHTSEGMSEVTLPSDASPVPAPDKVSNVLKWILLGVAIVTFALFGWATVLTYDHAPPQPAAFVTRSGAMLMTDADIAHGLREPLRHGLLFWTGLYGLGPHPPGEPDGE